MPHTPAPPACVGTYEQGHLICDGDPRGRTAEEQIPCAWRNRCSALRIYCEDGGHVPELIVATVSYEKLVQLCETHIERNAIVDGIPGGKPAEPEAVTEEPAPAKPPRPPKPARRLPRKGRVAPSRRNVTRKQRRRPKPLTDELAALQAHFETCLRDWFPDRAFATGQRVMARPGVLYPIRRDGYCSWYCTVARGHDRALAQINYRPGNGWLDIALPITPEELQRFLPARTAKRLRIKKNPKPGQFRAQCTALDAEGVGLVVETVRRLVEADLIVLPEPKK